MIKQYWNPNFDALLDPVILSVDDKGNVTVPYVEYSRILEAAGYIPDDREAAEFDEAAWAEDMETA